MCLETSKMRPTFRHAYQNRGFCHVCGRDPSPALFPDPVLYRVPTPFEESAAFRIFPLELAILVWMDYDAGTAIASLESVCVLAFVAGSLVRGIALSERTDHLRSLIAGVTRTGQARSYRKLP